MDRSTAVGGGALTLCNDNNKMKEILPETRHAVHTLINGTFFPPILKYLFLNMTSALEMNRACVREASIVSGGKSSEVHGRVSHEGLQLWGQLRSFCVPLLLRLLLLLLSAT